MRYATFDITSRCNLNCKHCYNKNKYSKEKYGSKCELYYSEIIDAIDILKDEGCEYINFLGGEPLIRNDFVDVVKYCCSKDIKVLTTTNGTLLDNKKYRELLAAGILHIDVSLEGTEQYNDYIRGTNEYIHVCNNLKEIIQKNNIKDRLRISYTLTEYNYRDLFDFILEVSQMGVKNFLIGTYMEINNDIQSKKLSTKTLDKNYEILQSVEHAIEKLSKLDSELNIELDFRPIFVYYLRNTYGNIVYNNIFFSGCAFKKGLIYIEANGQVHPCNVYTIKNLHKFDMNKYKKIGCNILDSDYKEKWKLVEKEFIQMFSNAKIKQEICNDCLFYSICDPCPFQFKTLNDYGECLYVSDRIENYIKKYKQSEMDFSFKNYIKILKEGGQNNGI